jgi:CO/xanthine dehydrogenase FAD-binding subunit
MKAAPFEYYRPKTLAEALHRLEQGGEDGRILAGGQSLAPVLALRLARPKVLIDINGLMELDYVQEQHGCLAVGALTRQRALERSSDVAKWCPLLWESMPLVGHIQTRNRGTIGGSLAHNDPAAELPAIALALDAEMVVASSEGNRVVTAKDFFLSAYSTVLQYNEMLTEIRFPPWPTDAGWAVLELSPHHGSFAIAGTAVRLQIDTFGTALDVRIALFGVDHVPRRAELAEKRLEGERINESAISDAAAQATAGIESYEDVQASDAYRRHVGGVLVKRALQQALNRAASGEAAHV